MLRPEPSKRRAGNVSSKHAIQMGPKTPQFKNCFHKPAVERGRVQGFRVRPSGDASSINSSCSRLHCRVQELKAVVKNLNRKSNFDLVCRSKFVNHMFELGFDYQDGTNTMAVIIDAYPDFAPSTCCTAPEELSKGGTKQSHSYRLLWPLLAAMCMEMIHVGKKIIAVSILSFC